MSCDDFKPITTGYNLAVKVSSWYNKWRENSRVRCHSRALVLSSITTTSVATRLVIIKFLKLTNVQFLFKMHFKPLPPKSAKNQNSRKTSFFLPKY